MKRENRKKNAYQMDSPVAFRYLPDAGRMHGKKADTETSPGYRKICHGNIKTAWIWKPGTDTRIIMWSTEKKLVGIPVSREYRVLTNCFSPVCGREKDTSPTTVLPRDLLSI